MADVDPIISDAGNDSDLLRQIVEIQLEAMEAVEREREEFLNNLAKDIEGKLSSRMGRKGVKQNQMIESLRLSLGNLATYEWVDPNNPFSEVDRNYTAKVNITRSKCEIAVAQTAAFQFAAGDKNWQLAPPQVIDVDADDVQAFSQMQNMQLSPEQVAGIKMGMMEREMDHHLTITNYASECRKGMRDRVYLGTGVMKKPVNIGKLKKVYRKEMTSEGRILRVPEFSPEFLPQVYRVNPLLFFPDDTVNNITDCEDSIEIHPKSKSQLKELIYLKGFDKEAIADAMKEAPKNYTTTPIVDQGAITGGSMSLLKDKYLVLEYHGPVSKGDLELMNKPITYETPDEFYYAEVWVLNGRVIRFELSNLEGCNTIPYCVSVWEPDPGSIFGFGVPMLIRDEQYSINDTFQMILDNAGISAGPQVIVDTTMIKPAEGGLECTPWKVWYTNEFGADTSKAMTFYMPPNAFEGLSQLLMMTKSIADEVSSISLMSQGLDLPTGAGDSATSMAIMNQNATSPLFFKAEQWDDDITKPLLEAVYDWEMQYNPKDEIKGSFTVDVRTPTQLLRGTQEQQKLERLSMEISQGSPMGEWVKMDGLVNARLRLMHLPAGGILKTPEEVEQERANAEPPPPDPALIEAQAKMEANQIAMKRLELEAQKLQMEMHQKNEELKMTLAVQMETNRVREIEAKGSVLKSQLDFQSSMAQLASRSDADRARIIADLQSKQTTDQTNRFLAGTDVALKVRQQNLDQEELNYKKKTGKAGI